MDDRLLEVVKEGCPQCGDKHHLCLLGAEAFSQGVSYNKEFNEVCYDSPDVHDTLEARVVCKAEGCGFAETLVTPGTQAESYLIKEAIYMALELSRHYSDGDHFEIATLEDILDTCYDYLDAKVRSQDGDHWSDLWQQVKRARAALEELRSVASPT